MINISIPGLRPNSVDLVLDFARSMTKRGLITAPELNIIFERLKKTQVTDTGNSMPDPKLITTREAAAMLGMAYSAFRAYEKMGKFPFSRRQIGSKTVRFLNTDIISFINTSKPENVA